jgi:hypothetical protein
VITTYTRSYYDQSGQISVPKNYDGTAFMDSTPQSNTDEAADETSYDGEESVSAGAFTSTDDRGFFGLLKGLPIKNLFRFEAGESFFSLFNKIGTEEILLLGVALFLLFSSSHDFETALLLVFLLFVR